MPTPDLPLDGVRVIDVAEHGFVPTAAAVLAEYGADVIKVERLAGDPNRNIIPSGMVATKDGIDYLAEVFNRNKRDIALDITTDTGQRVLAKLIKSADVFITNQLPQVQRKLHTTADEVMAVNPRIVYARGHGQGYRGPDAEVGSYDSVGYWSRGGLGHVLSAPDAVAPPSQRPALGDVPSGTFLAGGICAALVRAARTGRGGVVDASLLGSAIWTLGPDLAYTSLTGEQLPIDTVRSPLTRTYRTADGYFAMLMMINEARYWDAATEALGLAEVGQRYADPVERQAAWADLEAPFAEAIGKLTRDEIAARLGERGGIFSFFARPQEVLEDPAAEANGYLMDHPGHAGMKIAAPPVQFDNQRPQLRRAGPRLGEHTEEVLAEIGYTSAEISELVSDKTVISDPRQGAR
ncbi:MAG TPA: CoA transferase [Trebonia sp.]|jgi:crotonobetainyl-CoA:carnitine CoA-transferase CaiB-like acyl-CoA transferase